MESLSSEICSTPCNMRRKRPVSTALAAAPEDGDGTGGGDGQEVNDNSDDNAGPSVAKKNGRVGCHCPTSQKAY